MQTLDGVDSHIYILGWSKSWQTNMDLTIAVSTSVGAEVVKAMKGTSVNALKQPIFFKTRPNISAPNIHIQTVLHISSFTNHSDTQWASPQLRACLCTPCYRELFFHAGSCRISNTTQNTLHYNITYLRQRKTHQTYTLPSQFHFCLH